MQIHGVNRVSGFSQSPMDQLTLTMAQMAITTQSVSTRRFDSEALFSKNPPARTATAAGSMNNSAK